MRNVFSASFASVVKRLLAPRACALSIYRTLVAKGLHKAV